MSAEAGTKPDDLGGWEDDTSSKLRDAGFKIVRFGETRMVYIGPVDYNDRPDGQGFMFLANGDRHESTFVNGRAHGPGTYHTAAGAELTGNWETNKRVGSFQVIDPKGGRWTETYNSEGRRVARKKVREAKPNPEYVEGGDKPATIQVEVPKDEPAVQCWYCNHWSRPRNNHAWACRAHSGRFTEDLTYRGDGPRPGVWSCCGREEAAEQGCAFRPHHFMEESN